MGRRVGTTEPNRQLQALKKQARKESNKKAATTQNVDRTITHPSHTLETIESHHCELLKNKSAA
jgi:NAD-dependent SIR2 family protein deacetylase